MSIRYKHVSRETTRHGRVAYYYRAGGRRVRLPDDYGSDAFSEAVRLAATLGGAATERKQNNAYTRNRSKIGAALAISIKGARKRAQSKGVAFDLDLDWAIAQVEAQRLRCALTNIPFYFQASSTARRNPFSPSLDRIEAGKGYTKSNVRVVIYAINVMLFDWGTEVFERVVSGYRFAKGTKSKHLFPHLADRGPHLKKSKGKTKD